MKSIKTKILLLAIVPLLLLGVVAGIISVRQVRSGMEDEVLKALSASAKFYKDIKLAVGKNYRDNDLEDELKNHIGYEFTWFDGDTRTHTSIVDKSNNRPIGTKAGSEVIQECLKGKKEYVSTNLQINGMDYCVAYVPVTDNKGTVIGMAFCGAPRGNIQNYIWRSVRKMCIAISIAMLCGVAAILLTSGRMVKAIKSGVAAIEDLSNGEFKTVEVNRKDEIGSMLNSINHLVENMHDIVGSIVESSSTMNLASGQMYEIVDQMAQTTSDVSNAVNEISEGAVQQAEDVQDVNNNINEIADAVFAVERSVDELESITKTMTENSGVSDKNLTELSKITMELADSISAIQQCIINTGNAVDAIQDRVSIIEDIASQTNLLSLNASIEAARAGDSGRGFAVVANEIRALADSSSAAANDIRVKMEALKVESDMAMHQSNEVVDKNKKQESAVEQTMQSITALMQNIVDSVKLVHNISDKSKKCNTAQELIVDSAGGLSAISQENAASCEETNASMQELDGAVLSIRDTADQMAVIAKNLDERVKFFKF